MSKKVEEMPEKSQPSELTSLRQQRAIAKRNITNLKSKVEKDGEKEESTILECRLQILESYFKQLNHIQGQIEKINVDDNSRSDIEELFITAKAKIISLLNGKRRTSLTDQSYANISTGAGPVHNHRLPNLKLPKFDGKYADYNRFITAFTNMVDEDTTISKVDKFNYLLSCLSGQALAVIEPLQVTEANYPTAMSYLKSRFDNKVLIFLDHISTFFDISPMKKSDPVSLRSIIDTVSALRGSLLSLGSEMEVMNSIIIHVVLSKIDTESKSIYDEKQEFESLPSWEDCYTILSRRCQFLESRAKGNIVTEKPSENKVRIVSKGRSSTFLNSKANCAHCNSTEHLLANCSTFSVLPVSQRFDFVKKVGLCINCLRKGHTVSKCQSQSRCRVCHLSHHTVLHVYSGSAQATRASITSSPPEASQSTAASLSLITRSYKRAIIPTACILIKDKFGIFQPARALLDSCSEINFITEVMAKRLQLNFQQNNQEVFGIADIRAEFKHFVSATVKSRINAFEWSSNFVITKTISAQQPGEQINSTNWNIPMDVHLADPYFYKPHKIDLLISTEVFFDLLLGGKITLAEGLPCLVNTVFGWIVGGKFDSCSIPRRVTCNVAIGHNKFSSLDTIMQRFWEVEEYNIHPNKLSKEELECERHFVENVVRRNDGRVQVRLPFKFAPKGLGESFEIARRRFLSLERRLQGNQLLKKMYIDFMDEYETLTHMSRAQ